MVDAEFDQIWSQVEAAERDEEDKDKSEDDLKEEYRKIAERRVRLGLVLAEIGKRAEVEVPQEDLQREMINMARVLSWPGTRSPGILPEKPGRPAATPGAAF